MFEKTISILRADIRGRRELAQDATSVLTTYTRREYLKIVEELELAIAALNESAKLSANCAKGGSPSSPKPPAVSNCDGCGNKLDEDNYVHLCSDCYESVAE